MSQCVPSWNLDETTTTVSLGIIQNTNMNDSKAPDVVDADLDYEVAELTWENGQLAMHGLGHPRVIGKPSSTKYTWEKPRASGTLESIVNQAAQLAPCNAPVHHNELVPWFDGDRTIVPGAMAMDALVPSSSGIRFTHDPIKRGMDPNQGVGTCATGKSTRAESCGGTASFEKGKKVEETMVRKRARVPRAVLAREDCSRNQSVSVSNTFGRQRKYVRGVDSCEMELDTGFTSTSLGSDTNPNTFDDRDSVSHSRPQKQARTEEAKSGHIEKSSISTKRSRAAAIHNQSERKRRDKINQRMKTLQKLVPNSSKTDKASMLDEVIEYLKTLQAQIQMMSRMSMPHMMMPMTMQQQLQMSMMAQMGMAGMGMGMGMGVMDMNPLGRPSLTAMPQVLNPAAFLPMPSWDGTSDRLPPSSAVLPDPMASFLACQAQQPMTMDAYTRMATFYQQLLHQQQISNSKP